MSIVKAQVTKLAKSLYGKNAMVEERPNAMTAEQRAEALSRSKQIRDKIELIRKKTENEFIARKAVIIAAKKVVATDNDNLVYVIDELRTAITTYEEIEERIAEKKQLMEEQKRLSWPGKRCNVSEYDGNGPIPLMFQRADGDTWEEVLAKLKEEKSKKS